MYSSLGNRKCYIIGGFLISLGLKDNNKRVDLHLLRRSKRLSRGGNKKGMLLKMVGSQVNNQSSRTSLPFLVAGFGAEIDRDPDPFLPISIGHRGRFVFVFSFLVRKRNSEDILKCCLSLVQIGGNSRTITFSDEDEGEKSKIRV